MECTWLGTTIMNTGHTVGNWSDIETLTAGGLVMSQYKDTTKKGTTQRVCKWMIKGFAVSCSYC